MGNDAAERIDHDTYHRLEDMFVDGYRSAQDKLIYLRLASVPFELPVDPAGETDRPMHLKGVRIEEVFEVGNITPAFGTEQLVHQMYPHELVESRKSLKFIYVHQAGTVEKSLQELLGLVIEGADHHD